MFLFSFGIQISQITELNLLDSFLHIFHEVRVCVFCGAFVEIPTERKKITAARHHFVEDAGKKQRSFVCIIL